MTPTPEDSPCIELKRPRLRMEFTVVEYDSGVRRACSIGGPAWRLLPHDLVWADNAPAVEELRMEKRKAPFGSVRIFDPEAYHFQMRRLLGLI